MSTFSHNWQWSSVGRGRACWLMLSLITIVFAVQCTTIRIFQSLNMPPQPAVSLDEGVDMIKNFMMHFTSNAYPDLGSQIWTDMSAYVKHKWTPRNIYNYVRSDRNHMLTIARKEMGIVIMPEVNARHADEEIHHSSVLDESAIGINPITRKENDSAFEITIDTDKIRNTQKLELLLTTEEWNAIKPDGTILSGKREKLVLKPWVWTNVIGIAFWKKYKMSCAFIFKRADVKMAADGISYEILIVGKCKSSVCGNTLIGKATKNPADPGGLAIEVETRDSRVEEHERVKRPLNGLQRKEVQKELIAEGSSVWRKRIARENMVLGDSVPPHLPSADVVRQAKKEAVDAKLNVKPTDGRDLIRTIEELKDAPQYRGLINNIGSLPFFTIYNTPAQLHAYKEYCRINKDTSVIAVDATGSLVRKLERLGNNKTGHIFLYSIVINFEKTTIPVYQMISEIHTTEFLLFWLQGWIRIGAPKPREAVCDYSRALLSGLCMALNNITIKSYINTCFASVQHTREALTNISTFIRVDVAHLIHAVCRWKCFKTDRQTAIKDFFVRCVSLMVDSQTLDHFKEIFTLTCIVGSQMHEDAEIDYSGIRTTRDARKKLERYIAVREITTVLEELDDSSEETEGSIDSDNENTDDEVDAKTGTPIVQWVENLVIQARKTVHVGIDLNPFYLPHFVVQLSRIAKEFPLWTAVTLPYEALHASSSQVEGYFNDLKTRVFKDDSKPQRVDKFLKKHANDIIGGTLLFTADMMHFEKKGGTVSSLQSKPIVQNIDSCFSEKSAIELKAATNDSDLLSQHKSGETATKLTIENGDKVFDPLCVDKIFSIPEFEAAANDSDLLSHENWRGKATIEDRFDDIDAISENETLPSQLKSQPMDESFPSSFGTSDLVLGLSSADHSYSKAVHLSRSPSRVEIIDTTSIEIIDTTSVEIIDTTSVEVCKKTSNENESAAIKTQNSEKTKTSKFFVPFPEIRRANLLTIKTRKPSLLPNGSIDRRPLKIDNKTYFVQSTCGFDSLVHILMTSAIDDIHYASFLERSESSVLKFVWTLIHSGVTAEILRKRVVILERFYPASPAAVTVSRVLSYTINAWDSIANVITKTLKSAPSVYETHTCSRCQARQKSIPLMAVNHRTIVTGGFATLEKALSHRSQTYSVKCYKPCTGAYTLSKRLNIHIFIELDVRTTSPMPISERGMNCRLDQLPMTIRLPLDDEADAEYRLVGVVGYREKHFTAYCRRNSGSWQVYDDFQKGVTTCLSSKNIEPHLAVYVRQFGERCDTEKCPCRTK